MRLTVHHHITPQREPLAAQIAEIRLLLGVREFVHSECRQSAETFHANFTLVRCLPCVLPIVRG